MKKFLSVILLLFGLLEAAYCQEVYYNLYKKADWETLTKKITSALQKDSKNVVYNHVAGMMYANKSYHNYDDDKAYTYLVTAKSEYGKSSPAEREKISPYATPKKIQKTLDTVCWRLYEKTIHSNSIAECNEFAKKYKRAADSLQQGVKAYRNSLAFAQAQQENTVRSYDSFLTLYPDAPEGALAEKRRNKLAYDATIEQNSVEAFLS